MKDDFCPRAAPGFVSFHTECAPCSLIPTPLTACGAGVDVPEVMICPVLSPHVNLLDTALENQNFPVFCRAGALYTKPTARLAFVVLALR